MLRRSFVGILMLALIATMSLTVGAQAKKDAPKTVLKAEKVQPMDINTVPEGDLVSIGIDRAAAKKIVEARPFRNKRELVTKKLLSMEQYDKLKDQLIAKQPPKPW